VWRAHSRPENVSFFSAVAFPAWVVGFVISDFYAAGSNTADEFVDVRLARQIARPLPSLGQVGRRDSGTPDPENYKIVMFRIFPRKIIFS
jgi:type IV secretory pathway TrbD component